MPEQPGVGHRAGDGDTGGDEVLLDVPARPEYLSLVRQVVAIAAAAQGVRDERVEALRLAVSEATTNAVESYAALAAERDGPDGGDHPPERVVVRSVLAEDRIVVEVADRAGGFEPPPPARVPPPGDADHLVAERGRGLSLMGYLADEWDITTDDRGTVVRLVVHTPWRRTSR
jgi:serine/threonine-protein kinase RsbW